MSPQSTTEHRRTLALAAGTALLAVAVLIGVCVGAVSLGLRPLIATLIDAGHLRGLLAGVGIYPGQPLGGVDQGILLSLRLPRVILAGLVGGVLALAGAGYQGVFRNPLADPYLLGAAAGAGLGATLVISLTRAPDAPGHDLAGGAFATVPMAAFVGALAGVGLSYLVGSLAHRGGIGGSNLLLAGIAVASFLTAVQTLVQQMHAESLREVYSWILGELGGASTGRIWQILPYAGVSTVVLLGSGRLLDVLAVGDDEAASLGVRPRLIRLVVLLAASLGTAAAVSVSGLIGFVGLVVPHIVRRLAGGSYRIVLPVSMVTGAAFLIMADTLARTVLSPAELPIGVVTAFVGAPVFAALLRGYGER